MGRIIIIVAIITVVAGAFPTEAYQLIDQVSIWLRSITEVMTPRQQTALIIVTLLLVLGMNRR